MKYLNSHKDELFDGRKVTYRGKVYWANMVTMEIYCHSVDEEILGRISGSRPSRASAALTPATKPWTAASSYPEEPLNCPAP